MQPTVLKTQEFFKPKQIFSKALKDYSLDRISNDYEDEYFHNKVHTTRN